MQTNPINYLASCKFIYPTKVGHTVRYGIVRVAFCNVLTYTPRQSHEIFVAIPFVTLMNSPRLVTLSGHLFVIFLISISNAEHVL